MLRRELLDQAPTRPVGDLPLELTVRLEGAGADDDRAERVLAELKKRVQEVSDGVVPLRPGRVYCYWCRSNACEHGGPRTPRDVFIGYEPTGRPRFNDFADLALARGDPRIEGIYRDPPEPISIYDSGKTLRADQLPIFGGGSVSFNILGQVTVGYLPFVSRRPGERRVFSITFQATEARRRDGGILLDLNVLGRPPDGTLEGWIDTAFDGAVLAAVRRARRRIRELGRRQRGARNRDALEAGVEPFLNELAKTLERFCRQAGRRTNHVRDRRRQGDRPTRMALEDARLARTGGLFWDERHGTYIVLGPRGRTHVFNPSGRHITSVSYSRESIVRKQKQRHWRELDAAEIEAFQEVVRRSGNGRGEEEGEG
jgi:hypothetical protein